MVFGPVGTVTPKVKSMGMLRLEEAVARSERTRAEMASSMGVGIARANGARSSGRRAGACIVGKRRRVTG